MDSHLSPSNNLSMKYTYSIVILSIGSVTVRAEGVDTSSGVLAQSSKLIIHRDYTSNDLIKLMTL
jgi:hypothetical protein